MGELQDMAESIGADERTLRRAVRIGTVRARRLSPRTLHVSAGEKEYLRGHWPLLARLRAVLRPHRNVRLAVLFGSVARGQEGPGSDVDLLISLRDESLARIADLQADLGAVIGHDVQIVALDRVRREAPQLLLRILDEGRVLVDRDDEWRELQARRSTWDRRTRARRAELRREAAEALDFLGRS